MMAALHSGSAAYRYVDSLYTTDGAILTDFRLSYTQDIYCEFRTADTTVETGTSKVFGVTESGNELYCDANNGHYRLYYGTQLTQTGGDWGTFKRKVESLVVGEDRTTTMFRYRNGAWELRRNETKTNPTTTAPALDCCVIGVNSINGVVPTELGTWMCQFAVSEAGVTIHDLRPAVRRYDNTPGLKDIITGKFYPPTLGTITAV